MAILWYTTPSSGVQAAIEFDATTAENVVLTAQVSEHPVEEGINISDHVRQNPTRLSMECVITNTPINIVASGLVGLVTTGISGNGQVARKGAAGKIVGRDEPLLLTTKQRVDVKPAQISGGDVPPFKPGLVGPRRSDIKITNSVVAWDDETVTMQALQFNTPVDRVKATFAVLKAVKELGLEVQVDTYLQFYPHMVITEITAPRTGLDSIAFQLELVEFRRATVSTTTITRTRTGQKRAQPQVDAGPKGTGYPPTQREGADLESIARRLVNASAGL